MEKLYSCWSRIKLPQLHANKSGTLPKFPQPGWKSCSCQRGTSGLVGSRSAARSERPPYGHVAYASVRPRCVRPSIVVGKRSGAATVVARKGQRHLSGHFCGVAWSPQRSGRRTHIRPPHSYWPSPACWPARRFFGLALPGANLGRGSREGEPAGLRTLARARMRRT